MDRSAFGIGQGHQQVGDRADPPIRTAVCSSSRRVPATVSASSPTRCVSRHEGSCPARVGRCAPPQDEFDLDAALQRGLWTAWRCRPRSRTLSAAPRTWDEALRRASRIVAAAEHRVVEQPHVKGHPQMSLPRRPNAAVVNTPGSARQRPVNSSRVRLTRTHPAYQPQSPRSPGRTYCCASQVFWIIAGGRALRTSGSALQYRLGRFVWIAGSLVRVRR